MSDTDADLAHRRALTPRQLSSEQLQYVERITDGLLAFGLSAFVKGTVTDVVGWWSGGTGDFIGLNVAFVGDARKIAKAFGFGRFVESDLASGARLDAHLSRALRIKPTDLRLEPRVGLADFLDRVGGQAIYVEEDAHGALPFDEVRARFIPEPGYPWPDSWTFDGPYMYWSAKKRGLVVADRPGWLMQVVSGRERREGYGVAVSHVGVNPCLVFPPEDSRTDVHGPSVGQLDGERLFVTHSMALLEGDDATGFHKQLESAIEGVRACGGLLFPSLAVGPLPASNFGPITLVARLELVLASLKPYRNRSRPQPSWVYASDAWTETTGMLMNDVALRLFSELHGHEDFIYGNHMWVLGPPAEALGSMHEEEVKVLDSTQQLFRALQKRMKRFRRDFTFEQFERQRSEATGFNMFAYCEAKAREVVSLDEFPYLIAADSKRAAVEMFVAGVGYRGEVVYLPDTLGVADMDHPQHEYRLYQWAWIVADAIMELERPIRVQL